MVKYDIFRAAEIRDWTLVATDVEGHDHEHALRQFLATNPPDPEGLKASPMRLHDYMVIASRHLKYLGARPKTVTTVTITEIGSEEEG